MYVPFLVKVEAISLCVCTIHETEAIYVDAIFEIAASHEHLIYEIAANVCKHNF